MKRRLVFAAAFCAGLAAQAVSVSNVRFAYDATLHHATITYDLADGPAIVTLDILTNATVAAQGVSIGGANMRSVFGDVNKVIPSGQNHVITWKTDVPAAFAGPVAGLRPVVNVWTLAAPPEVMVIDLSHKVNNYTEYERFYYPSLDALPGGVTGNAEYKTTKLVMKHIHAPVGGKWMMGSYNECNAGGNEAQHEVSLTEDFWLGVFELTQYQTYLIFGSWPQASSSDRHPFFAFEDGGIYGMRPLETCCFNFLRGGPTAIEPSSTSLLGYLRSRTGYAFDFPGEMQWEYAARCGHPPGRWGDGSAMIRDGSYTAAASQIDDPAVSRMSRNRFTGGATADANLGAFQGTAIVGSYAPSDWGLYDMHGNVSEMCRDWYVNDITALDGVVQTNTPPVNSDNHVIRGGSYSDYFYNIRPCRRISHPRNNNSKTIGCRLYAPISPTVTE